MRWGVIKLRNKVKKAHKVEFFENIIIAQGLNTQGGFFLIVEQREKSIWAKTHNSKFKN